MIWLRLLQFAGIILVFAFAITQIILPAITSRKLFPIFRKSEKELSSKFAELNQQLYEGELKGKVDELDRRLHPTTPAVEPVPTEQKPADTTQS